MPTKKKVMELNTIEKIESFIKKVWLANLGICSRSINEIQERYEKLSDESQRLFDDLVSRGETIEAGAKKSLDGNRERLEARIEELKKRLTVKTSFGSKLDEVSAKLDKLSKSASES
jgi:polyhydroxyalkanoate synthesis regulator phasin